MTVNSASNAVQYLGDGSTTLWAFPFPIIDTQFIHVAIVDSAGVTTTVAPNLFQVTMNPPIDPNPTSVGGTVLYPISGSPLAIGNKINIVRILPVVQDTSISNQSIIYPPVVEQALDYLTLLIQGGTIDVDRSFKVPFGDPLPADVPTVALRKNQMATFDNNGDLTPALFPPGTAVISAAMQPVVAAATIAAAQILLGTQAMIDASIAALPQAFTTGDLKPTHKTIADPGWIIWSDGSIGNTGSGSTIRANPDTQNLFNLYYNSFTDTTAPLQSSAGATVTRVSQGTALAAWNAGCRILLPKGAGRALALAGVGMGLTNRVLGSLSGVETVTPSTNTMAPHLHSPASSFGAFPFLGDATALGLGFFSNASFSGPNNIIDMSMTVEGAGQPTNIMQPTTFINVMVKL